MIALLTVGLKMLLAGGTGFFLRSRGIVNRQFGDNINSLLLLVIVPCATFDSAQTVFDAGLVRQMGVICAIMVGYYVVTIPVLTGVSKLVKRGDDASTVREDQHMFVNLTVFPNTGFIGFAVILEIFGSSGLLLAVTANLVFNIVQWSYGAKNLASGTRLSWRSILLTPVMIGSVVALGMFFSPFRFPEIVASAIHMLAATMTPLAIMVVGISLAEVYLPNLLRDGWSWFAAGMRLLVVPALLWAALKLLRLHGFAADVSLVLMALPSATGNIMLASKYGTGYQYAVHTVVMTNVAMFATVPLALLLAP